MNPNKKIFGAGAALVDLLIEESEAFLSTLGSEKGGMTMVEPEFQTSTISKSENKVQVVPGGSACNTLVGVAELGGSACFLGNVGDDDMGQLFKKGINQAGVDTDLSICKTPTGQVLSVVTPDAQRTMFTYLGASAELAVKSLESVTFKDVRFVHLEGYLAFNAPYFNEVVKVARKNKVGISLDLSSFEVVRFCRELIDNVLSEKIEILIANEDEAKEFAGTSDESGILEKMSSVAEIAVYKLGAEGVVIQKGNDVIRVNTEAVKAADTTGAGDLWASGFLYGLTEGWGITEAAQLGNKVAGEVVKIMGAKISESTWSDLNEWKNKLAQM